MEPPLAAFDGYPRDYIAHNLPLIVLSGLAASIADDGTKLPEVFGESGTNISSESPVIEGDRAEQLLQEFYHCSKTDAQWNSKPVRGRSGLLGFKFRAVGRDYTLPPRKAEPPSELHSPEPPTSPADKGPPQWLLHSPISPLSPASPIFPDGVMTPIWISKHQDLVPSTFISFFAFSSDPARNSLLDNQLKNEINNVKAALYRSEYKTRYVVVLLSDKTILEAPDIEDRLANIRRTTSLDAKSGFFFLPPNTSRVEVASFVESLLSILQPLCVEYYRDLTKHARRKKNRGSIPPPTAPPTRGTSQTLASLGWGVRYDFKLGAFAEFRQEMEAACRHYTSALESLLGPDGIFETTASWSPRWDEARLLADTIAFRVIRCLLWSNLTTTAAQSWSNYRDRMRELVDRRGKGSSNYGWEAWESKWAKIMAELVQRAELQSFQIPEGVDPSEALAKQEIQIFAPVEKAFPVGERLTPWHHLHHPGYWWRQAAKHTKSRRHLAMQLPEEDRIPPGLSPASAMASRYGTYDTYLCPEPHAEYAMPGHPGYNHSQDLRSSLEYSKSYFRPRAQMRISDEITLEMGKELMHVGQTVPALEALYSLWQEMSWRREKWWRLVYEVTQNLYRCAKMVGNVELLAAAQFELCSSVLPFARSFQYDLMGAAAGIERKQTFPQHQTESGPAITLSAGNVTSFLSTSFVFLSEEGNAGESVKAQLSITSKAHKSSKPVALSQAIIQLDGGANQIIVTHKSDDSKPTPSSRLEAASLREAPSSKAGSSSYTTEASLNIHPGQTIILEISLTIREAGPVSVRHVTLIIKTEQFCINYLSAPEDSDDKPLWWLQGGSVLRSRRLGREESSRVQILPRPPRMELRLPGAERQYYTDEAIQLAVEVVNMEDEETEATLEVRILSHDGPVNYSWTTPSTVESDTDSKLPGYALGDLASNDTKSRILALTAPTEPTEFVVEVKVLYHLFSDRETPVSKTLAVKLNIVRAFEANYDFEPRVHEAPWPTLFGVSSLPAMVSENDTQTKKGTGIVQRWHLASHLASFATDYLILKSVDLVIQTISGGATVVTTKEDDTANTESVEIKPTEQREHAFMLHITKSSLEDRRSTTLDMLLRVIWMRQDAEVEVISTLPIPPLSIPNSEPRVLCSRNVIKEYTPSDESNHGNTPESSNTLTLTYTLENPTAHFLTFDLSMESSDDFAFSGSKLRSLNLLPLARETVQYRILPLVEMGEEGGWIDVKFRVVDRYFKKVLRVLSASSGIRDGKGGGLSIFVEGALAGDK